MKKGSSHKGNTNRADDKTIRRINLLLAAIAVLLLVLCYLSIRNA